MPIHSYLPSELFRVSMNHHHYIWIKYIITRSRLTMSLPHYPLKLTFQLAKQRSEDWKSDLFQKWEAHEEHKAGLRARDSQETAWFLYKLIEGSRTMKQAIRFKLIGCITLSSSQRLSLLFFKMEMMLRGEVSMYSIWALWEGPLGKWL